MPKNPVGRLACALICISLLTATCFFAVRAQTSLQAALTPTVIITGPLGSLQQVQYSTNVTDPNSWTLLSVVRVDATNKPFFDTTAQTGPQRFYRTMLMGVADTNLVWIPPGTFLMGSPTNEGGRFANEGPQTPVTLTQGFLMGRYEIRIAEIIVYITNYVSGLRNTNNSNIAKQPAFNVVWDEATNYCGLRTSYEQAQGMIPTNWSYRLPTEAEWEYACRSGTTTPFSFGNELRNDAVRVDAWFDGAFPYPTNLVAIGPTTPPSSGWTNVDSFSPNAFGLYNMHGNESEWCLDTRNSLSSPPYPGIAITNPVSLEGSVSAVVRGGGIGSQARICRSAARRLVSKDVGQDVGFRVVLAPVTSP